ncbi:MAG: hypothetical protein ACYDAG_05340, partial [Chloroflexota bacterium]
GRWQVQRISRQTLHRWLLGSMLGNEITCDKDQTSSNNRSWPRRFAEEAQRAHQRSAEIAYAGAG